MSAERRCNRDDEVSELTGPTAERTRSDHRWLAAGAYLALILGCFLAGFLLVPRPAVDPAPSTDLERIELPSPQPVGDFALEEVDPRNGPYTRDRLVGQWTLMYFGYSHCPDVCRPTLEVLADVARGLRAAPGWTAELELVFVTVDPARDTPEVLRAYLSRTTADLVGLRGSEHQIAALAAELGLMHAPGDADDSGNYLVDHPATILLIDPDARLRAGFPLPHDPGKMVERVLVIEAAFASGRAG